MIKSQRLDFVEILNDNKAEAILTTSKTTWKVLREMAVEKGYIDSYRDVGNAL